MNGGCDGRWSFFYGFLAENEESAGIEMAAVNALQGGVP